MFFYENMTAYSEADVRTSDASSKVCHKLSVYRLLSIARSLRAPDEL